jgi:hypothetical protein
MAAKLVGANARRLDRKHDHDLAAEPLDEFYLHVQRHIGRIVRAYAEPGQREVEGEQCHCKDQPELAQLSDRIAIVGRATNPERQVRCSGEVVVCRSLGGQGLLVRSQPAVPVFPV